MGSHRRVANRRSDRFMFFKYSFGHVVEDWVGEARQEVRRPADLTWDTDITRMMKGPGSRDDSHAKILSEQGEWLGS